MYTYKKARVIAVRKQETPVAYLAVSQEIEADEAFK